MKLVVPPMSIYVLCVCRSHLPGPLPISRAWLSTQVQLVYLCLLPLSCDTAGKDRHRWNDRGDEASIMQRKQSIESVGLLHDNKGAAYLIQDLDETKEDRGV